jgi:hypothetical protein
VHLSHGSGSGGGGGGWGMTMATPPLSSQRDDSASPVRYSPFRQRIVAPGGGEAAADEPLADGSATVTRCGGLAGGTVRSGSGGGGAAGTTSLSAPSSAGGGEVGATRSIGCAGMIVRRTSPASAGAGGSARGGGASSGGLFTAGAGGTGVSSAWAAARSGAAISASASALESHTPRTSRRAGVSSISTIMGSPLSNSCTSCSWSQ